MLPVAYGRECSLDSYIDTGEAIAADFDRGMMSSVVDKINNTFFGGGVFSPKSFSELASVEIPRSPTHITVYSDGRVVEIRTKISNSAILGYIEAIPVMGSCLAIINAIGHLYHMGQSYRALQRAVVELQGIERTDHNMARGACSYYADPVFDAAVDYTVHRNHMLGSLLSIIPFAKPTVRLAQGILYQPPVQHLAT